MNTIINRKSKYKEKQKTEGNERIFLFTQQLTNINSLRIIEKEKKME
jgi:hypothetical protein